MKIIILLLSLMPIASFANCIVEAKCENDWVITRRFSELSANAIAQIDAVPNAARLVLTVQKDGKQSRYAQVFFIGGYSSETYLFESSMIKAEIEANKRNNQMSMLNCQAQLRQYRDTPRCQ
jgi:hypothetical protein